ncbi:MAG TPA: GntR family transcriptional regulator [Candidatus Ventrimonas merdavium]|nr:GntR family transcriptional regulator [Candidatus Ventrimonas merdavium]
MQQRFLTSDEVYEDLCEKIEKLVYMPGERLSENELCKIYGVSRHIVRSAITRLKDRLLITVYPQRGTFVSLIDMRLVEKVLYLREALEQEAIRLLKFQTAEVRAEMVRQMWEMIGLQEKIIESRGDMDEFYKIDNAYHACLLRAVKKENVMDLISHHYIHVRRWRNFELGGTNRQMGLVEEHREITKALEQDLYKRAHEQLHVHLNTVERLSYIFKENSPEYFIFD